MSGHLPGLQQLPFGQGFGVQDQTGPAPLRDLNSFLESFFRFFIIISFDDFPTLYAFRIPLNKFT